MQEELGTPFLTSSACSTEARKGDPALLVQDAKNACANITDLDSWAVVSETGEFNIYRMTQAPEAAAVVVDAALHDYCPEVGASLEEQAS